MDCWGMPFWIESLFCCGSGSAGKERRHFRYWCWHFSWIIVRFFQTINTNSRIIRFVFFLRNMQNWLTLSKDKQSSSRPWVLLSSFANLLLERSKVWRATKPENVLLSLPSQEVNTKALNSYEMAILFINLHKKKETLPNISHILPATA